MIRTIIMLGFWAIALPIAAIVCIPWVLITGKIAPLYRFGMWAAFAGVRLAGARVKRRIYTHVNNTNPILLDGSLERHKVEQAGWEVAYDGMVVDP